MRSNWELPSPPVIVLSCLVLALAGFLFLRAGAEGSSSELSEALDQTLATGASYTAVNHIAPVNLEAVDNRYEGYSDPGTSADDLNDYRSVLRNLYAVEDVRRVGAEMIDTKATTHYSAAVNLELQAEQTAEHRDALGLSDDQITDLAQIYDRPPQIDVWIDNSGLIRRFYISESFRDGQLSASTTIDFYDFPADS